VRWLARSGRSRAVLFGIGIRREGYNLFALGPSGTGKHTARPRVLSLIRRHAKATPSDWCYINNFTQVDGPIAHRDAAWARTRAAEGH
jgi:hypothetical protein